MQKRSATNWLKDWVRVTYLYPYTFMTSLVSLWSVNGRSMVGQNGGSTVGHQSLLDVLTVTGIGNGGGGGSRG